MLQNRIKKAFDVALQQRNELVNKLVSFVVCDSLLFVLPDVSLGKKERLEKAVFEANVLLGTSFTITGEIDVPVSNLGQDRGVFKYFDSCSDEKVAYIYLVATALRSVLTAILSAERKISRSEAFELAFYEEICQQEKWGLMEDAEQRQSDIKDDLEELERIGYERGIFKD